MFKQTSSHSPSSTKSAFAKSTVALLGFFALAACAASQPRIIQPSADSQEITLTVGMATQIEMPDQGKVQTIAVGNPSLVTAEKDADIVSLTAKGGAGETNLIVRARDEDGHIKLYQYRIVVQDR
jgi:uncharacterized lipoprotein YajG